MTPGAREALARDLAHTTVMSRLEALARIDMAVEAMVDGRRLVEDDHVERVIRTYSTAVLSGLTQTSFGDFLGMMRILGSIIGETAAGPISVQIVKDKGGPHGDG